MNSQAVKTSSEVKGFYEDYHVRIPVQESRKFNRWFFKILKAGPEKTLLDIACGRGYLVAEAKRRNILSYGVDISERALHAAVSAAGRGRFVIGDAQHLPWRSGYFDLVTCLGSLEHFLDPPAALAEMIRVARDDAVICLLLPNMFSWDNIQMVERTGEPPTHSQELERFATRWQWQRLIEQNGLEVKRVVKYNGFPQLFELKKRMIKIRSLRKFFRRFFVPFNLCSSFIFICEKKR